MPLNGSDVASKPAGTTAVANTTIESSPFNSVIDDIYAILNTTRTVAKGYTGASTEAGAIKSLKIGRYQTKSSGYTAVLADIGTIFRMTSSLTLAMTAAATLGTGWWCMVLADGGDVTVDPNSSETINGSATLTISDGEAAIISCDGTAFYALKMLADQDLSGYLQLAGGTMTGDITMSGADIAVADNKITRPQIEDYSETVNAIGSIGGGTQDIDLESGNVVTATVDTSTTTFTFSNPPATGRGGSFTLILTNGGSQTVNWPASVDWAGGSAPTLTSSGVDVLTFITTDGGTTWLGFVAGLDMS